MGPVILAVDAGTTRIKSVAVSLDGAELAASARPSPVTNPRPGWVEQDMTETWDRTATTLREVTTELGETDVVGLGVTGQGAGCWLVDDEGTPVRDAILWSDGRASAHVARWRDEGVAADVFEALGHGLFPGLPLPILRWLRDEEPSTLAETETAFFCKDWIRYSLTGDRATDPTDASLVNYRPDRGRFSREVPARLGVGDVVDAIPDLRDPTDVAGHVTDEAAARTGVPAGTPVVTGLMDVAASAFGSGTVDAGSASSVVGTTLQNQVLLDEPAFEAPKTGYTLALGVDGMGLRAMGAMTGTPNVDWAVETLGGAADFAAVEERVRSVGVGSDGVMYHPYLSAAGEKAPFVHPGARAQFTGLRPDHTAAHLLRAVYEGVALAMRDCYEHLPGTADRVAVSGGGSRSAFWCQLFADCLDAEVVVPAGSEFGAKGVAELAGVALGYYDDLSDAAARTTTTERAYEPTPERTADYDRLYAVYRETAEAMADVWDLRMRRR